MLRQIFAKADRRQKRALVKCMLSLGTILVTLVLAVVATSGFSFGWFSANDRTTSTGLNVTVHATSDLLITTDPDDFVGRDYSSVNDDSPYLVISADPGGKYYPATHDAAYPTGLKYVTNNGDVDINTGVKRADAEDDIAYADAVNGAAGHKYYLDTYIYIAAGGSWLTDATLKLTICSAVRTATGEEITSGSLMATSVDVYETSVSAANYRGTLNVAGVDRAKVDYPTAYTSGNALTEIYLIGGPSSTGEIPESSTGYLTYVLRYYFDGALQSGENQTYVYSSLLDLSDVGLDLLFSATGTESD